MSRFTNRSKGEAMDVFGRVGHWNSSRNLEEYDRNHEFMMIEEELDEYLFAPDTNNELKELADIIFVAVGSLVKKTGNVATAESIFELVCNNNDQKGTKTKKGKIVKDTSLPGVEELIGEVFRYVND